MELLFLTLRQVGDGFVIAAFIAFAVWLFKDTTRKPRPVSGQTYLYSRPSDDDFFDTITEFRNDIPGK